MSRPVGGLLPSLVRKGHFFTRVKNLGWLMRNWKIVEAFDLYPHPPTKNGFQPEFYLVARLRDGRTYETGYSSLEVFHDLLSRSRIFAGVPIAYHPKVEALIKSESSWKKNPKSSQVLRS